MPWTRRPDGAQKALLTCARLGLVASRAAARRQRSSRFSKFFSASAVCSFASLARRTAESFSAACSRCTSCLDATAT